MKALSPVRALRSCHRPVCCVSERSLSIGPRVSAGPLCDMSLCYSRLRALVPSIPRDKSLSQVEILQHVIDYICDLQVALEAEDSQRNALQTTERTHNFSTEENHLCL
ncbi:unnamed protein product [Knipowitschia caucasica]